MNGDQIFPAQLEAIRSARTTISYAQYFYEESPIAREIAEELAARCLNEELNAVVYATAVAGQLEKVFAEDLTYSRRIDYERWQRRGVVDRLLELLSLPVREQL